MTKPVVLVSDHAVIRYMERVMGLEVERVRDDIRRKVQRAMDFPDATAINVDGFRYLLEDGTVKTIIKAHEPDPRTSRVRRERRDPAE